MDINVVRARCDMMPAVTWQFKCNYFGNIKRFTGKAINNWIISKIMNVACLKYKLSFSNITHNVIVWILCKCPPSLWPDLNKYWQSSIFIFNGLRHFCRSLFFIVVTIFEIHKMLIGFSGYLVFQLLLFIGQQSLKMSFCL